MLQLRQAECAMADGRLDEAYRLAQNEAVRGHRKGQRLIKKLADRYAGRARAQLKAGHARAALTDCGVAVELAGPKPAFLDLRAEAQARWDQHRNERRQRDDVQRAAHDFLDQGRLSMAERVFKEMDTKRAEPIREQVRNRRRLAEPSLQQAEGALKRGEYVEAITALIEVQRWNAGHKRFSALSAKAVDAATGHVQGLIQEGRLASARRLLDQVENLCPSTMRGDALRDVLILCEHARENMERGEFRACEAALNRLARDQPKIKWIADMAATAGRIGSDLEVLRAGPLGASSLGHHVRADASPTTATYPPRRHGGRHGIDHAPASNGATPLPELLLLTVDGAGSYLVCLKPEVRVGPISSAERADVALVTDPASPVLTLRRTEGGYFAEADRPFTVAHEATHRHLLRDGDSAALSPRCRMTLSLPHPASGTGVLRFSGARLPRADVKAALLVDRELLVGPTGHAHIRTPGLPAPVALVVRHGRLAVRRARAAPRSGHADASDIDLPLDHPVDLGGVTATLNAFA